jgi:hypothetical protein
MHAFLQPYPEAMTSRADNKVPDYQIPIREIRVPFSLEEAKISKPLLRVLLDQGVIV